MNILIVKLGSIGDIVHTLPALSALRRGFPNAHIGWLVETRSKDILAGNPLLDEILEVDTLGWRKALHAPSTWKEISKSVGRLRSFRYDVVFDFQGLVKSGVCAWLARAPRRVGFERRGLRESLSAVFTNVHVAVPDGRCHVIDKNLSLLKAVGIETEERAFPIRVPEELSHRAANVLESMGVSEYVAINPGGGWATKRWSPELYGILAAEIYRVRALPSLVFWGPEEKGLALRVAEASSGAARIAPATELKELLPYLVRARLFIGGDTGPLHIASALGVPVVGLFGPSDATLNGPVSEEDQIVWKGVPCSPCYRRRCPGLGTVCMTSVEVRDVLRAVEARLGAAKSSLTTDFARGKALSS